MAASEMSVEDAVARLCEATGFDRGARVWCAHGWRLTVDSEGFMLVMLDDMLDGDCLPDYKTVHNYSLATWSVTRMIDEVAYRMM